MPQHVPVHAAPADDLPTPAPLRRESTGHHSVDSAPDDVPKMELVLDLDHTLLNAVEAPGVGLPPPGCTAFTLQSPGGGEVRYLLRLRDGLASFLEQAARIAKLHVYTMGTASYCREVMTLVDPKAGTDGQLVTGKLLCRDDGQAAAFDKSLEHVCKGAYSKEWSSFIVLDDKEEAWDGPSRKHVLKCTPFQYFDPETAGPRAAEAARVDTTLLDMLRVLRAVHLEWSRGTEPSVVHALANYRLKVLEGVHLVLSGGLLSDAQQPQRCMYWRLAEAYGAKCHYTMDAKVVTHIVAGPQPSKTVSAWRNDPTKHVVSSEWLLESAARWARQDERDFGERDFGQAKRARADAPLEGGGGAGSSGDVPTPMFGAALDEEGLRRAVDAIKGLIPASLSATERLKIAIRFLVRSEQRPAAAELFARFDAAMSTGDDVGKKRVLDDLTLLVGKEPLKAALEALGVSARAAAAAGRPFSRRRGETSRRRAAAAAGRSAADASAAASRRHKAADASGKAAASSSRATHPQPIKLIP